MSRFTSIAAIVAAVSLCMAAEPDGPIRFKDVAGETGLHFVAENCPTPNKNQPETMLAGVAMFDYDQDGFLDIYFTNGAAIPSLRKEEPKYENRLFHNDSGNGFTDVTHKAGVSGAGYGIGVAVGDYDNDGWPDLFLANVTTNQLFHNNGDGTFTDVAAEAGVSGAKMDGRKMWAVGAGWFDYDNDGHLDLFVVNYCKWEVNKDPFCQTPKRTRAYCEPRLYEPLPNTLFRNNGDGTFTDVSAKTGIFKYLGKGMSVSFADYDEDGFLDAFVTNDTMRNFLFHNLGGKKFEEVGLPAGVSFGQNGVALSGMGSDFKDLTNDGKPDIWHTAVEMETFPLFIYRSHGMFQNATFTSGLGSTTPRMSGWGNGIADFDNDGWKDLFAARANVLDNVSDGKPDRKYPEPNSVFRNIKNGKFKDVSSGAGPDFRRAAAHRGVAFGDFDNDGRIDAVVTVLGGPARLFRNVTANGNHWILLQLTGTASNRMAIGALVKITDSTGASQWNMATTSVGYASASDVRVHFGLARATTIPEMVIRWPSGREQVLKDVSADRILKITEPEPPTESPLPGGGVADATGGN